MLTGLNRKRPRPDTEASPCPAKLGDRRREDPVGAGACAPPCQRTRVGFADDLAEARVTWKRRASLTSSARPDHCIVAPYARMTDTGTAQAFQGRAARSSGFMKN